MRNDVILSKMITYAETIQNYCAGLDHDGFLESPVIVDACVFNLSQIGELAGRVDDTFRAAHAEIKWSQIKGLRNKIVHDYEGVNKELIWEIIGEDIPKLISDLKVITVEDTGMNT